MGSKIEINPELKKKLLILMATPKRNTENEARGRSAFLQEALELANTVTPSAERRHKGWMNKIQSIFIVHRKEHSPMVNTLASITLIVSLLFGGGGVTVAAAQSSEPDQLLYSIKLWSESLYSSLVLDPQSQFQLALDLSDRRSEEIQALFQSGILPSEAVQSRYVNQVEQTIRLALNLTENRAALALQQIQTRLESQQQAMSRVQINSSPEAGAALIQTRSMLQVRLQWVEEGLINPDQLRNQIKQRNQLQNQYQQNLGNSGGYETQIVPGLGVGNSLTTGTPTPGSGYGPGDCVNCTPSGDGQVENPWTNGTPTPGSSYGPGFGDGSGSQISPQQSQPTNVPGGPGGKH